VRPPEEDQSQIVQATSAATATHSRTGARRRRSDASPGPLPGISPKKSAKLVKEKGDLTRESGARLRIGIAGVGFGGGWGNWAQI
jgi:hypothetical protein